MRKSILHTTPQMHHRANMYVVIGLVLLAIPITIFGQVSFLTSTLLFFGVPSAYLIWRRPRNFKKAFVAGVVIGLALGFPFDFVAEYNHAWGWGADFALPVHLFGVVSLDVLVWFFLWVFLVVAFYEYFIEDDRSTRISPRAKWVGLFGICVSALVVYVWHTAPHILEMDFAYAKLGTITVLLCGVLFYKNPHIIWKTLRTTPFFAFMYLAYEITALSMNLWTFPGAYLGSVSIGAIAFPLEEFIVWVLASSAIVAAYYEFCIDDNK